ncbi:ATP-binding cassette domain-containing protein [Gammaproteobacteria bacterium]|nr:ATP-binding cassette domain-containing protein [Gammaproteobacteria bacterium]
MASVEAKNLRVALSLDKGIAAVSNAFGATSLIQGAGGRIRSRKGEMPAVIAVDDVSLTLKAGDRLGLIGGNGAGKTTLLKTLAGIYTPTLGYVRNIGHVLPFLSANFGFDPDFTGLENLKVRLAFSQGRVSRTKEHALLSRAIELSALGEFIGAPVRIYSAGMTARLGLCALTFEQPDILIMDEWIGAGDERFKKTAKAIVDEFAGKANVLILASHSAAIIEQWTNRCLWMDQGKAVLDGPTDQVLSLYTAWTQSDVSSAAEFIDTEC